MRTIKFRGKNESGEWQYGNLVCYKEDDGEEATCIVGDKRNEVDASVVFTPVDPDTVGQFTGLHDRNGMDIYEGDIIKNMNEDGDGNIGYVNYNEYWATWLVSGYDWTLGRAELRDCYSGAGSGGDCCEVIGNIHDNPELLSRSEQA